VACSGDSSLASFTDLRERLSGAVIFTYKDNMETIRRTLSTRKLKARRGDTSADDQHPHVLKIGNAGGDNNSDSGHSSESRSRGDTADRRSPDRRGRDLP